MIQNINIDENIAFLFKNNNLENSYKLFGSFIINQTYVKHC